MSNNFQAPDELLKSFFEIESLKKIYEDNFKTSTTKGIDRLNGIQFREQATAQIRIINSKCLQGTYKFSPFLELLQSKGREKTPRILAIPTIRDRIVLHALKDILGEVFTECKQRKLANTYIHEIKKFIAGKSPDEISVLRGDIENFYGSIDRDKLFFKLNKKIESDKILTLIKKAIITPIVPKNYHRKNRYTKYFQDRGIPQGLSISNMLASIYLQEFDNEIENYSYTDAYWRYVDDILIFTKKEKITEIETLFEEKLEALQLKPNREKTRGKVGEEQFEYLGYSFKLPKITITTPKIEKFIHSVAAKFSIYIHNREKNIEKPNYHVEKLKAIFIFELNEKITGAISEKRRYGLVFYFNAINDISALYMIDNIIANFFKRLEDFGRVSPPDLKKVSRAFYEAKHNQKGGYIHNYDNYKTVEEKTEFLRERGKFNLSEGCSNEEINELYESIKQKNLLELERDDAILS